MQESYQPSPPSALEVSPPACGQITRQLARMWVPRIGPPFFRVTAFVTVWRAISRCFVAFPLLSHLYVRIVVRDHRRVRVTDAGVACCLAHSMPSAIDRTLGTAPGQDILTAKE